MQDNLPPGVSGHEDAFGPKFEEEVTAWHTCSECGLEDDVLVTREGYNTGVVDYWTCVCGVENSAEVEIEDDDYYGDADWGDEQ